MRRVVSFGGPSGVPASQRLKLKLSLTAGMHLLTNDAKQEQQGFLAPVVDPQHERIIHRTWGVTRNLSSIESFKGFVHPRRDTLTSEKSATLESADGSAKQSTVVESGLDVAVKTKDAEEVDDGIRQRDDAGENRAVNKDDYRDPSSDLLKSTGLTTSSSDLTITPAYINGADSAEGAFVITGVSHSGAFVSKNVESLKQQERREDGTHAPEPSVTCPSERLQEEYQSEASVIIEVVDQEHIQDLKCETRVCELVCASSTASITTGVVGDTTALRRDTDGGYFCEHDQAKDSDESEVVKDTSTSSGKSRPNGIQEDLLFERNETGDGAALRIQSCWKGWLQRRQYRRVKQEVLATTRQNQDWNNAAIVFQKSWRAAQCRLVFKHLKIERTVRNRAATVIQANIRGHSSRSELKKLTCAVLTIQNCWRRYRSLAAAAASARQAEERKLHAAITLQAYVRGFVVRQELVRLHKAAITIQREWKAYNHMCSLAATTLQAYVRGFLARRKYARHKKTIVEERAAVIIQACVRGHLVRCHLTILHTAALIIQLQWRMYYGKRQLQADAVAHGADPREGSPAHDEAESRLQPCCELMGAENEVKRECFDGIDFLSGEDLVCSYESDAMELFPEVSSLEKMVDIAVDQEIGEYESTGVKGCDLAISARRDDSGLLPLLNGELPAIPGGESPVGKASPNEDWNNVSVDELDECLDTCLASLRPLHSDLSASVIAAEQCFPKFVILEEAQQPSCSNRSTGFSGVDGTEAVKVAVPANAKAIRSHSTPRLQRVPSRKGVKHEVSRNVLSNSSDAHLNLTTLSSRDSLEPAHGSSAKLNENLQSNVGNHQVEETDQGGGKLLGKSRHGENLKRNEERLQQFAQVFLLQRHIAYQQQRAQSAPPFPPPTSGGSGSSQESQLNQTRDFCTVSGVAERDCDSVTVVQTHNNTRASQVTSRHSQQNLDRGNVSCSDTSSTSRQPQPSNQSGGPSSFKQHRQGPGTDVVVDMVVLLRKIEEVYGTSHVEFADANNSCIPTRRGDIEEGGPVLDRRKISSALGFTKSISMTQIGLPNVNAMLLIIIAMVVYTKTICQGVIFGTKQTHRKI